ncbi:carboxymuconolactone decarboxylase family protein [Mailhella sp.]|uniref:carboxymuconolactone decarboxylase family protein n=1 Tax=Mailhella sp. TaxID=1981029 RepID=UPI003AB2C23E
MTVFGTVGVILLAGMTMLFSSEAWGAEGEESSGIRASAAARNMQKFLGGGESSLGDTDPDFAAMRDKLIYGEIMDRGTLSDAQKTLVTLAALTAAQTLDDFKTHVNAALRAGATPVQIKEAMYQCAPYVGFPRVEASLRLVNETFAERGIALPLESQSTVTEETRYADGLAVQKSIFGDAIDQMHRATPAEQKAIVQNYLSAFCFGDVYTRKGLDLKTRELVTFAAISAFGGCDSQVRSHVQGNLAVGNTKENLIDALAQLLPFMGFPRTLNTLACVNAVAYAKPNN